jgi:DNA topoisomerase-1
MANVFGFTAKRTMDVAQKLFEKGFITYHRTDSFNLSPQFINETRKYINSQFGKEYLPDTPNTFKTNLLTPRKLTRLSVPPIFQVIPPRRPV